MLPLRFSDLSPHRQAFVRECQQIGFGAIHRLSIVAAEPVFSEETEVLLDLKLDGDDRPRPEHALSDFALCAEIVRLFAELEVIREGVIENVEVRAGVPRRIAIKISPLSHR